MPTTRTDAYSLLEATFRTAVARKPVKESPVSVEEPPPARPEGEQPPHFAQVQELADAMRPQHCLMVLLAAWCSLRFGELAGLHRHDISLIEDLTELLTEGIITVEQAAVTFGDDS